MFCVFLPQNSINIHCFDNCILEPYDFKMFCLSINFFFFKSLSASFSEARSSKDDFFSPDIHELWHGHNDCLLQRLSSDRIH